MRSRHAKGRAVLIPQTGPMRENPTIGSIFMLQSMLQMIVRLPPRHVAAQHAQRRGTVVRMDSRLPFLETILNLPILVPEHLFPLRRVINDLSAHIPIPNADIRPLDAQRQSLSTVPQRFLSLFAIGDIDRRAFVSDQTAVRIPQSTRAFRYPNRAAVLARDLRFESPNCALVVH